MLRSCICHALAELLGMLRMLQASPWPGNIAARLHEPGALLSRVQSARAELLGVLRLAIEAKKPLLAELALDLLQKLLAHGHLAGPVHAISHRREPAGRGGGSLGRGARRASEEDLAVEPAAAADTDAMPPQVRCWRWQTRSVGRAVCKIL